MRGSLRGRCRLEEAGLTRLTLARSVPRNFRHGACMREGVVQRSTARQVHAARRPPSATSPVAATRDASPHRPSSAPRHCRPDPLRARQATSPVHRPAVALSVGVAVVVPLHRTQAMTPFRKFLRTGHAPTLFAAFLYFAFSCCTWVLNGAMAPFISESFHLSPAQKGLMLSVPIIAGALFRFPLGVLSQYIGRKRATLVEMGLISIAMLLGFFFVQSFNALLAMGVLLGVAGASFGVAMSLGSGSFPPQHKGLAMGIVGAGNVGTAVAVLIAPPLAQWLGWQTVYAVAAVAMG